MKKEPSTAQPQITNDDNDDEITKNSKEVAEDEDTNGFLNNYKKTRKNCIDESDVDDLHAQVRCITLFSHKSERLGRKKHKNKAAITGKQVKARGCNPAMVPAKVEDVAQLLSPKWAPPLEMVTVGWLGDWRPSAILELLKSLAHSSYLSLADSGETDRILSQLIREIRIEEAIIDEEMAEIQATCILQLPFRPTNLATTSSMDPWDCVQTQLKKIKQVITKAQQLRCKALEIVANKVLSHADAKEFLVAFSGIQDVIHQFAARQKLQKGPVHVSIKALASV